MRTSTVFRRIVASGMLVLAAGGSMAESIFRDPVDLTLKLRIKVEGNVAAINQGLGISCMLNGASNVPAVVRKILAPGQIFVPQTADGFVETSITFENLSLDHPVILENNEGADYNPAVAWNCHAVQIGASGSWEPVFVLTANGIRAVDPVYRGSCPKVSTLIDHSGEFPFVPTTTCAE